jgi:gluconolactonase
MLNFLFCLVALLPAAAQEVEVATTVAFTEGPTVDREGNVYFSENVRTEIPGLPR